MKKGNYTADVQDVAGELAFCESNRYDAVVNAIKSVENYWELKALGIKQACSILLGVWPTTYTVAKVERPYVVVAFGGSPDAVEYRFDANTFELIK